MKRSLKPLTLAVCGILLQSIAAARADTLPSTILPSQPWNSAYLYEGSYDTPVSDAPRWAQTINSENALIQYYKHYNAQFQSVYVYASDLEFPCQSSGPSLVCASDASGNSLLPLTPKGSTTTYSLGNVGFFFGTPAKRGEVTNSTLISMYHDALNPILTPTSANSNATAPVSLIGIIDGRIDDGYLQGFNGTQDTNNPPGITTDQAKAIADLIAEGSNAPINAGATETPITGICQSNLAGVQMDLEPFKSHIDKNPAYTQIAFYTELGTDLKTCGKFFSVFTFAGQVTSALTPIAANGNFYVVDSLYDLPENALPPLTSAGAFQTPANIPTPLSAYQTNANAEAVAMANAAVSNKIPFKYVIPAAASAHEFQSVAWRNSNSPLPGAGVMGPDIMPPTVLSNSTPDGQLDYALAALAAINSALTQNPGAIQYFRGIDVWGFSPNMQWSPHPTIIGYNNGTVHQGNYYVYFSPSSPSATEMNYLISNDCLDDQLITTTNYPAACKAYVAPKTYAVAAS